MIYTNKRGDQTPSTVMTYHLNTKLNKDIKGRDFKIQLGRVKTELKYVKNQLRKNVFFGIQLQLF